MGSSSDSTGARVIASLTCGVVRDLWSNFGGLFFASPALVASNLNNAAIAISRMKSRFSKCMVPLDCVHDLQLQHYVASGRDFSVPAIDSRIEVSAWTFFILT